MATPTINNLQLDKTSYTPGETAKLTFDAQDPDTRSSVVTVTVTDSTGASGTAEVTLNAVDPVSATVTDSSGRVWTKGTVVGTTYTWTATV